MRGRLFFLVLVCLGGFALGYGWYGYRGVAGHQGVGVATVERVSRATGNILPEEGFSRVAADVAPAVVNIVAYRNSRGANTLGPLSRRSPLRSEDRDEHAGSGVIVETDGVILTNYHVVQGAGRIRVTLQDRREYDGVLVGSDPKTDLAVVRIDGGNFPAVRWGDSDKIRVGDFVLALGSPFGLARTVTMGIVSATGRTGVGITDYEDFIQTDAAINPGNSGGPLVNAAGALIGINTAIISESGGYQGIGFAVPSNLCRFVLTQLLNAGHVDRGWLGLSIQEIDPALAVRLGVGEVRGALVADLEAGPAQRAGLRPGDVIVGYDGKAVQGTADFRNRVATTPVGRSVVVDVIRDGRALVFHLNVAAPPARPVPEPVVQWNRETPRRAFRSAEQWIETVALSPATRKQLDLPARVRGLVVRRVHPESPGWLAGLRRGDVIREVDGRPIERPERFVEQLDRAARGVLLYVQRGDRLFFVVLKQSGSLT